jgi:glycosyltransferase involved in cell wall biosynthesis
MNIAHLLPGSASFPLKQHNGRYEWTLRLAQLQATQGHNVTIYCGPSQPTAAPNLQFRSLTAPSGSHASDNLALWQLAFQQTDTDIFHSHFDSLHYAVAKQTTKPIVYTQHWFPHTLIARAARDVGYPSNVHAVPVTHYMAAEDKRLGIPSTLPIYHGIDLKLFAYSAAPRNNRLIFVGRIAPHKGVREAILYAKQADENLDIIGKIAPADRAYWEKLTDEVNGTDICYLGAKPQTEVAAYLQQAKALLFPNQEIEAFGQTIVEAQACGTPVIASNLGANQELIDVDKTGFVATTPREFIAAMRNVSSLSPHQCRINAEKFDVTVMAERYQALYATLCGSTVV